MQDDEGGSGGNATDGGARTDGEVGPDGLPHPKKKKRAVDKAPVGGDDYDHGDDWIDDEGERGRGRALEGEGLPAAPGSRRKTKLCHPPQSSSR